MSLSETAFMVGKEPGWYEGWWCGPDGVPGGWIFMSYFGWYRGDGERPSSITPDVPRRSLRYWDGTTLSKDRLPEQRV